MAKIQPSVLNIQFSIGEGVGPKVLDLSESASIVNRRFYRQGLNWVVAGFTVATVPNQTGNITIAKIPNTWIASNSWHKSYAAWKEQQDEAVDEAGAQSRVAKYRDFKIHCNGLHVSSGFGANLIPVDRTGANYSQGEWEASQIVIPNTAGVVGDTDEFFLHMVGADLAGSFSMISGYANSRAFPHSPDPVGPTVSDSFLSQMFNVGMDDVEILQNVTGRNDDLPYHQTNYPGGGVNAPTLELVHEVALTATVNSTSRQLSGTNVPCGLLEILSTVTGSIDLFVHLVPGPARGYLTQPMQDM